MKKVMGYLIGYRLGSQMLPQMLPGIEADDVVAETLAKGVKDGISGDMDMSLIDENVDRYQQEFLGMLLSACCRSVVRRLARLTWRRGACTWLRMASVPR